MEPIAPALALLRGLHTAALLSAFGTMLFAETIAPAPLRPRLRRHARIGAGLAVLFGLGWFAMQAAVFAAEGDWLAALPETLWDTRFGHALGVRLLLIAAIPFVDRRLALLAAGLALSAQGLLGHAGATVGGGPWWTEPWVPIGAEALHLLAAGAWLGALLPLLLCLRTQTPADARLAARRFSPLGMVAVATIAATALVQSLAPIGDLPGLIGTDYGRVALLKLALFGVMLGCALWNRVALTDRLVAGNPHIARQRMGLSIAIEAACGLAVVLAGGLMASLIPAQHQAPVWPLGWRPSLEALQDEDLRQAIAIALATIGAGVAVLAASCYASRCRTIAAVAATAAILWQAPTLRLLSVAAYPTSYQTSPTGFAAASILRGRTVFAAHCAACHGAAGDGQADRGALAKAADLTAGHLWDHPDGELFWWVGQGIAAPNGDPAMPGFAPRLSTDDRWAAIDFAKALNAGASMRRSGSWTHPVPAPDLPIVCNIAFAPSWAGQGADRLSDLRGRFVRVTSVAGGPVPETPDQVPDATILRLDGTVPAGGCGVALGHARDAFAILAGLAPDRVAGFEFLIDPAGWLRAVHEIGRGPDWSDPAVLNAALRTLRAQPISDALGGIHVHGR